MPNNIDRAVQFKAFDALKGFREALEEVEDNTFLELDKKLNRLNKGEYILVKFYNDLEYLETRGKVKEVKNNILFLENTKIEFKDIVDFVKY